MAIWDVLKRGAIAAKCASGWHAGKWQPVNGKPECNVEKVCPDCNKEVSAVKHKYGNWEYNDYSSCNAIRRCIYCEHLEKEVRHDYMKHDKDENCIIIEKCKRCGELKKTGQVEHNWITIFDREIKVQGKRKCKDCGRTE